jgi:hypothetical protein
MPLWLNRLRMKLLNEKEWHVNLFHEQKVAIVACRDGDLFQELVG